MFKKSYKTTEFISSIASILLATAFYLSGASPVIFTYVITGILSAYILSRGIFKKSRGSEQERDGFTTSEFRAWALGVILVALAFYFKEIDPNTALINLGILSGSLSISRGTAKGIIPQNKAILIR